jgi:hypothetical protein
MEVGNLKKIELTKGKYALVDDSDFEFLSQWKWCAHTCGYAVRSMTINGKRKTIYMHRLIMGLDDGSIFIDHINHNRLDNRKENLRFADSAQNKHNEGINSANKTGYKGVIYNRFTKKYQAKIRVYGQRIHLGSFETAEDAAKAYQEAAIKYHGDYVFRNS